MFCGWSTSAFGKTETDLKRQVLSELNVQPEMTGLDLAESYDHQSVAPSPAGTVSVCIDAVPLLVPSAGVKSYVYHWISSLRSLMGNRLTLFPFLGGLKPLNHRKSVCGYVGTQSRLAYLHYLNCGENTGSDRLFSKADIFHATKLLHPPKKCRLTATLHDATCWILPQVHTAANVSADKRFCTEVLQRADGLIAVSEHTRLDAVRFMRLDPDRIEVIHPGVPDTYFQANSENAAAARRKFGLKRDYILFAGTIEPRKNLSLLLDAYAALPASLKEEFELVIAGFPGWANEEQLSRLAASPAGLRYLGYVPEFWMPGLFAGATVFAFPSLYEGFGFPLVQALAAGVPTITSYVSALPEVAGNAAEFIDPSSPGELLDALFKLLTSPGLRARFANAGRKRAELFRWDRCALQTIRYFEKMLGAI